MIVETTDLKDIFTFMFVSETEEKTEMNNLERTD